MSAKSQTGLQNTTARKGTFEVAISNCLFTFCLQVGLEIVFRKIQSAAEFDRLGQSACVKVIVDRAAATVAQLRAEFVQG